MIMVVFHASSFAVVDDVFIRVDGVCTLCSTTNALQHRPEETTVVRAGLPQLRLQQCHLL
jgi:hypothetical protein